MSNGTTNGNGDVTSVTFWATYLIKQGPIPVFLGAMFYFVAFFVFPSMRADQTRYIDATIANNAQFAKAFSELQQTHAAGFSDLKQMHVEANKRLDVISAASQEQTGVLRQIRDDQRNGVWNKNGGHQ